MTIISISTSNQSSYIFYNSKKPWWKKKPILFLGPNTNKVFDLLDNDIDIERLFIKFDEEDIIHPIKEHCSYY